MPAPQQFNIIPSDDSTSVFDVLQTLSTLQQAAIVRPNNPPPGIGGFLFHLLGDEEEEQESDITDHYVEDNTAIQDHWPVKPLKFVVRGLIAEFTSAPVAASGPLAAAFNPLPPNPDLQPTQSQVTQAIQNNQAAQKSATLLTVNGASNQRSLYGLFQNTANPGLRRQTNAYLYFLQLQKGRQLCSVETPWGIQNNMALTVRKVKQGEESRDASDFTITFKKMTFVNEASVVTTQAGRTGAGNAPPVNHGNAGQVPQSSSLLNQLATTLFGGGGS